ncbi:MAG TPA: alpha/beta fold hydrolase [Steroidobacteraceae bacterium]|nr:alpha/beta fold hydrolase [Steroidobacteraceae bacterium]
MGALYHEVCGTPQGRDVVLLHGWSLNLGVWAGLVRELGAHFRVIAIDLPGHGRSDWDPRAATPAAQAWRVHETLLPLTERYALLGWSLGGQLALDLAAALPASVERLVLIATTPKFLKGPSWRCGTPRPLLARLAHRLHAEGERAVSDFLALAVRGSAPRTAARALHKLRDALRTHGAAQPEALASGLARLREGDLRAALPLVRVPALVVAGQRDRVIRPAASRALARALPEARYVEVAGAAHVPFLSHPRQFVRQVGAFLHG